MKLTDEQRNELKIKLGQYFLDYSVIYSKNVIHRYDFYNDHPGIGRIGCAPSVGELMGIIIDER